MIWLHQAQIGLTGERGSPIQRSSILFLIVYDHLGVVELSDPISPTNSNIFRSMNLANKPHGHYHINLGASSLFFLRMVSHSNFQFQFLGRQNGKKILHSQAHRVGIAGSHRIMHRVPGKVLESVYFAMVI